MKKTALAMALAVCMLGAAASADTISFSGKVEASETVQVYAPVGGTAEAVPVRVGETVAEDTVIAKLRTTKVYAEEDGIVTSVFGQPGDDAASVAQTYGAVMYVEGPYTYSIEASTSRAYDAMDNYIVHSGEVVYLVSRNRTAYRGEGIITSVDGSNYTVLVTSGEFYVGDSLDICRDSDLSAASRIGRGNVARVAPKAVTGTGSIVSCAVKAGDRVKRGQLLFETADGVFDGLEMTGAEIRAGTDGVIASLNVSQGAAVAKDSMAAEIYPKNAVWVAASVAETDLAEVAVGQKVKVELDWNEDQGVSYEGTVAMISAVGTAGEESTTYQVYVSFTPDENTRYGMTALVTTLDGQEDAEAGE